MATRRAHRQLSQLWQLPLLIVSLALFAYAAYLFIDPKPGLSIDQKVGIARQYLDHVRYEAAIEHLNRLLNTEKLDKLHEGQIHLMLAEALEQGQRDKKLNIPQNHRRIIEQSLAALANDVQPTSELHRRMAESYEALHLPARALVEYRQASLLDPNRSQWLAKKIINLALVEDDRAAAAAGLEEYLARKELADNERSWALGETAHLLIDRGEFAKARLTLAEAAKLCADSVELGQISYWLSYCSWKLGQNDQAERYARVARDQMHARHPLDGDACYILGRIAQDRGETQQANSFYEVILRDHPDSKWAALAKLGRGVCRVTNHEDDAGLTDLHDLVNELNDHESLRKKHGDEVLAGLRSVSAMLSERGNFQGALEVLTYEQDLTPEPAAEFFGRLGTIFEKRARQVEQEAVAKSKAPDKVRLEQQARDLKAKAGDAYIAYSRALTTTDDKGYGDALWRGIALYDQAGDLRRVIAALNLFVAERPTDALAPEALLRLGKAYQAGGLYDLAIKAFQDNQFMHPKSLAAAKSAVPLAQAYIAKGPDHYAKAENVLLGVVDNNPLMTPEALEFRQSLFELAQLYYRTTRYEESIGRLEELTERYPDHENKGQLLFLMADGYRRSAQLLVKQLATTQPSSVDPADAITAKRQRLTKARILYDRVIDQYKVAPPKGDVDKLYCKLSYFYRADCVYDLTNFDEAIRLYDAAAFRYQDDPSSLAAYVQIVNAYCALGRFDEARTANERAKWMLKKMPAEAFKDEGFNMPKEYWDTWLRWTTSTGLWQQASTN